MNVWKVTTFVFAGLFAASLSINAVQPAHAEEMQPHMKAALGHLKKAALQLEKASHDKGGHRVRALKLTRDAIDAVEQGIRFDDKN